MNAPTPSGALAVPTIPINDILPSLSNPRKRFDETYLNELAASIREHGLIQPITVRPISVDAMLDYNRRTPRDDPADAPRYEIVVGECRWRAAFIAGLTEIPAFWRELNDKEVLEIQVIENLQRRDVHPLEEADGYLQLTRRHAYRAEDIAEKIGKSRSYVFARMKLASLGATGRALFFDGRIDASVALLIARLSEKDQDKAIAGLLQYAGDEAITFRNAKWKIRNGFTKDLCLATWPLDDPALMASAGSCTACPKRSGTYPELHPDINSADVCTDTRCFEEKRLARHAQLLDGYQARKVPVYSGDEAKTIATHGTLWSVDRDQYIPLDDAIPQDEEGRTYRDVLGTAAPVTAVVEVHGGNGNQLVEVADATAMAQALQAAGVRVAKDEESEDAEAEARREELQKKQRAEAKARGAEVTRRIDLRAAIQARLIGDDGSGMNTDRVIAAVACAALRQTVAYSEWPEEVMISFGIEIPEEYDEAEELDKACAIILGWPVGTVLALLAELFIAHELSGFIHIDDDHQPTVKTPALDTLAKALNLVPGAAAEAPPPTKAAQAREEGGATTKTLAIGDRVRIADSPVTRRFRFAGKTAVITDLDDGDALCRIGDDERMEWIIPEYLEPLIETNETPADVAPGADEYALKAGDRVRVKNDVRGPGGKRRKCCGREGVVETAEDESGRIAVRFAPGANGLVTNLVWNEVERIADEAVHA